MGAGKTDVGRFLAKKLGKNFIETDTLIAQQAGKSIPEIFEQDGEIAFRELEIEITKRVAREKDTVIACGGGAVLNKINIDRLREGAVIVYLTASPKTVLKRVASAAGKRPLLAVDNPILTIGELLRFRRPFYERAADIRINTSRLTIPAVVGQIIAELKRIESLNT